MSLLSGITKVAKVASPYVDAGIDVLGNLNTRRTVGKAAGVLNSSIDSQGRLITDARKQQEDLYNQRRADYAPYAEGGAQGVSALRKLVDENPTFDVSKVTEDPGYQFGLDEGLKKTQRMLSANGTLNSGQSKAFIRYANDYATTKVNDARQNFRADQQDRLNRINALTGVGEFGATGQSNAAGTFGNQIGDEATALAKLEGERGDVNFGQQVANGNSNQGLLNTAVNTGGSLLKKALGIGATSSTVAPASPGLAAAIGAGGPAAATGAAATAIPSGAAAALPGAAGAAVGAPATGLTGALGLGGGSGLFGLGAATIPVVGGALLAGAAWLKSQAHWEANDASKAENSFHQTSLAPFAAQWDQAVKSGAVTQAQGHAALDQYIKNFQDYTDKIEQWGQKGDKKKVAEQSVANLYKTTVGPQIARMQQEIAGLPA